MIDHQAEVDRARRSNPVTGSNAFDHAGHQIPDNFYDEDRSWWLVLAAIILVIVGLAAL